jgi:predicted glycoside hydrolase/deacetylase ChbG (UPF0249 family)
MMRIIVNADDLGISESVNEAIFQGMQRGVLTSATMLANGSSVKGAARELRRFPNCSFGVHLNLTEFEPVCQDSHRDLKNILDENECFKGNAIREINISPFTLRAVFREWCHQIESLTRLGLEPSHLDTHHHVHTIPQMIPVLAALRKRYKINKIRLSRNMYGESQCPSRILLAKKWAFNLALRTVGFRTTRIFTDLQTFIQLCGGRPPVASSAELMTHPGALPRDGESHLLEIHWPSDLSYQVELISYKSL